MQFVLKSVILNHQSSILVKLRTHSIQWCVLIHGVYYTPTMIHRKLSNKIKIHKNRFIRKSNSIDSRRVYNLLSLSSSLIKFVLSCISHVKTQVVNTGNEHTGSVHTGNVHSGSENTGNEHK